MGMWRMVKKDSYWSTQVCGIPRDSVTGRLNKGSPVKHAAGVPYLVDCNVTGHNEGTATNPMSPLRKVWEHSLLHVIEDLVHVCGWTTSM
jgi:hypothetical protein